MRHLLRIQPQKVIQDLRSLWADNQSLAAVLSKREMLKAALRVNQIERAKGF